MAELKACLGTKKKMEPSSIEADIHLPFEASCYIEITQLDNASHYSPSLLCILSQDQDKYSTAKRNEKDFISAKEWRIVLRKTGSKVVPVKLDPRCSFSEELVPCVEEHPKQGSMILKLGRQWLNIAVIEASSTEGDGVVSVQSVLEDIEHTYPDDVLRTQEDSKGDTRLLQVKLQKDKQDFTSPQHVVTVPATPPNIQIEGVLGSQQFCQDKDSQLFVSLTKAFPGNLEAEFVLKDASGHYEAIPADVTWSRPQVPMDQFYHGLLAVVTIPRQQDSLFIQTLEASRSAGQRLCLILYPMNARPCDSDCSTIPINYIAHNHSHCCHCQTGCAHGETKRAGQKRPAGSGLGSKAKRERNTSQCS